MLNLASPKGEQLAAMKSVNLDSKGIAIALLSTATWGTAGIFIRWLPGWSPFAILAGRFLVAAIALLPIVLAPKLRRELFDSLQAPYIWSLSIPMIGGFLLGTTAFQMAPVGEVTLFFTTSPFFVAAYKILSGARIHRNESIGTLLSMAGVILIVLPQLSMASGAASGTSWQTVMGYGFALSGAGLLAVYILWFGAIARKGITLRPTNIVFVTCLLGCVLSSICTVLLADSASAFDLTERTVLVILGLGILSTATSTLLYTVAAQRLPALLAAAFLLTEPLFAVLYASVLLKESPSVWFGFGSALVLSGLLLISKDTEAIA